MAAGDKEFTVKADAEELTAGAKLKVVAIDSKTKKYVLVNAKTYTVSKDGDVKVSHAKNRKDQAWIDEYNRVRDEVRMYLSMILG